MKKRNFIAKDLLSKKYKPRIVKPKKGRGKMKQNNCTKEVKWARVEEVAMRLLGLSEMIR